MLRMPTASDNLAKAVDRQVRSRTFEQVRDLRVELLGSSVVLHGRVETYYIKQLAQNAALELLQASDLLVNKIVVEVLPSLTSARP